MTTMYWLNSSNFSSPATQPLVSKPLSHFLWILPALSLSISPTLYKSEWIRLSPVLTVSVVSSGFGVSSQFSWMLLYVWFSGMHVELEFWRVEPNWLRYWLDGWPWTTDRACPCHSQRATQAMAVSLYFIPTVWLNDACAWFKSRKWRNLYEIHKLYVYCALKFSVCFPNPDHT